MRVRNMFPLVVFGIVTVMAFGQTRGVFGKWGTDGATAKTPMTVALDLSVGANGRVAGSITEYASALCGSRDTILPIDDGIVQGNVVTFVTTTPNPCPAAGTPIAPGGPGEVFTWTGVLGDNDSLSVTRTYSGARGANSATAVPAPQNPAPSAASRNPVSGSRNPVQGMTTNPVQGMTTPPIQPQGRGIAPSTAGGGRTAPGGGAMAMQRL